MKKSFLSSFLFLLSFLTFSQSPQGFNYQAVIRDGSGTPIANQTVSLKITLQSPTNTEFYVESKSVASNAQGVINHTVGTGNVILGTFSAVPWSSGEVMIKVEIDPNGGTSYTQMGDPTKLQSVPYALYAENTKEVVSQTNAGDDDPIFVVKNKAGQIVFAVYQTGVRVYVEDSQITKGVRGGFAIGGLTNQSKGQQEYFRITPDSARIYVKENPTAKGVRGGFAIGGLTNQSKTVSNRNLMFVAPDSTRIWVNENVTKGVRGGFAIGGLTNQSKGTTDQYLNLTPDNYFIGQGAGKSITTGLYNSFIGYQSGFSNTSGNKNYFIGYRSGYNNISGFSNVFIGDSAGFANISGYKNVFIGNQSGLSNTIGKFNTGVGIGALHSNTEGGSNSALGENALYSNTLGIFNTAIGRFSLWQNTLGSVNTAVGTGTLMSNTTALYNTAIGGSCLLNLASGNGNTAVGALALQNATVGVNNTAIGYNSFQTNAAIINSTALGANAQVLASNQIILGDANITLIGGMVGWSTLSDGRFKNIVKDEVKGLDFITRLKPVIYTFDAKKFDEFSLKNLTNEKKSEIMGNKDYSQSTLIKRSGFIAQDVEKAAEASGFVFNGVHHPSNDIDNYSIDYSLLTVPLVKAVQELNSKNEELQKQVDALKAELEEIKALLKK